MTAPGADLEINLEKWETVSIEHKYPLGVCAKHTVIYLYNVLVAIIYAIKMPR